MAIRTHGGGGDFEIPEPGLHKARCIRVIYLGTQHNQRYNKWQPKVMITWELPEALVAEGDAAGQPLLVSEFYTASHFTDANLRKVLEGWYGKRFDDQQLDAAGGFDLSKLIGRPAMLNLVHSANGKYANVSSIAPARDDVSPQVNPSMVFDFEEPSTEVWGKLSDKMQAMIARCQEWPELAPRLSEHSQPDEGFPAEGKDDDDIPFIQIGIGLLGGALLWSHEAARQLLAVVVI